MERLAQLIGKLNEQFAQNADPFQLLVTAQLIETELVQMSTSTHRTVNTSKVAVVMPAANGHSYQQARQTAEEKPTPKVVNTPVAAVEPPVEVQAPVVEETPVVVEEAPPVVVTPAVVNGNDIYGSVEKNNNNNGTNGHHQEAQVENGWKIDPLREVPTLAHQQVVKELNEVMATSQSSLNEKLKEEVKEVAHVLNDAPVRDLRRAIGINDRFVFISELFRNDEVMYERSIKTINSFRILPEAQYWIERELKVKLGWDENKESTRHFYQLVKRRFS
ncbi:hypothetical protein A4H97_27635 [Niastella yeongjuensis]|uniref:Uncharacterized protein n=1 Tax=Niastella yeongjuensis TaxID=354355 RepID=A0A1V9EZ03_9BACT|nr:hypothetical protein [Niastella yeongjuensis]OQP51350.1 hypothetical protein A4H97_27635 [Niastella yeongjuensis]SEP38500.1 hypothetical protein SAMN05660816_05627 [Niastella yeongjuensis]